jgi:hypothetical protein
VIERLQLYVARFQNYPALLAGYELNNFALQTDSDAPFRAHSLGVYVFDDNCAAQGPAGNVLTQMRYTRPDGSWVQRHLISSQALNPFDAQASAGAGGLTPPYYSYFSALHPNLLYPAQSTITFDFGDTATNLITSIVYVVFMGTKLYKDGAVWAPTYPKSYKGLPYNGYSVQLPINSIPVYNYPLTVRPDADFVWRAGSQTDYQGNVLVPIGGYRGLGVRLKDWAGKYYMNDFVPLEALFGFDNSQRPGLIYPEIYIPKNEQIYLDLVYLGCTPTPPVPPT